MTTPTHTNEISIYTDDAAVLNCLRALAHYSERGNKLIAVKGTKDADWLKNNNQVTFHFTTTECRAEFLNQAKRVLPTNSWKVMS